MEEQFTSIMNKPTLRKEELFYIHDSEEWELANYLYNVKGKGDCISRTMEEIRKTKDKSPWSYKSLEACKKLLIDGNRWPNYMNQPCDSKTWIEWKWSQLWWQNFDKERHPDRYRWSKITRFFWLHKETVKYRPQHNPTRDGYIYFYACATFLGKPEYIKEVKMPWYLYNPEVWRWRRHIIHPHRLAFVNKLRAIRGWTTYENLKNKTS